MTTSAIRRRYGYGAARLCIEAQPVRWAKSPPLLPNATSGAATVLVGGLAVFALLRSIQPPEEPPSEIRIVELQEVPQPPPEPEPEMQPAPEPPPPEPEPEPVVVAQAPPPPPPKPVVRKVEPPKRRAPPARPKPEPVRVARAEPAPEWKRAPIAPPKPEPPPAARRPPVQIDAPKAPPVVAEASPPPQAAWKPVAVARAPSARPAMPRVAIDSVAPPVTPEPAAPSRAASLPPGVTPARKPSLAMPSLRPVPAAAAPDFSDAPPARGPARAESPTPSAPAPARRPPPAKGLSMPGISAERANAPASAPSRAGRDYARPGVTAPPAEARRSEPSGKLRGVPLGSLAACRSDKLEDDLKQRVLAAVRNREECSSSAGHYRFVETKNLNAFLMWIERAPGRAEGDRCAELSYALACLRGR